jgi:TolA-binding protein
MFKYLIGAGMMAMVAAPAAAQQGNARAAGDGTVEGRVGRLESEMRAVQRKVFPNGATAMVEPQTGPAVPDTTPDGVPASAPIADLNARVTSLEQQLSGMTGQIEQAQFRLRQLEDSFAAYRTATDAKLAAGGAGPVVAVPTAPRPAAATVVGDTATAPDGDADATVAIDKPATGDAAEDGYLYGYRLWTAKKYAEAETQLKKVVADHPRHRRASFAQNLLGRAYLDDGKPSLASIAFYDSYKKFPDGERAPDSLYYLGSALVKLNKPADACKVYGELTDVYGDKIAATMKADITRARAAARCK